MGTEYRMQIEWVGLSDRGLVRRKNEDYFAFSRNETCFILADGMGGHPAGEIAAKETVSFLCRYLEALEIHDSDLLQITTYIKEAIKAVNQHIFSLWKENLSWKGMGTTVCLSFFTPTHLIYGHIGDSRIYKISHQKQLFQLTQDHSLRSEFLARGIEDPSKLPSKHVITRAIGTRKTVELQMETLVLNKEDLYLMCSDGLTDHLTEQELLEIILENYTLELAAAALMKKAKERGGKDNITLLLLKPHGIVV